MGCSCQRKLKAGGSKIPKKRLSGLNRKRSLRAGGNFFSAPQLTYHEKQENKKRRERMKQLKTQIAYYQLHNKEDKEYIESLKIDLRELKNGNFFNRINPLKNY